MPQPAAASRLEFEIVRTDIATIVRCRGKMVAGVCDSLYTEVSRLIPDSKRIVLDLTELTHMDSLGLGTVVRLYVSTKAGGTELQLINLGPRLKQLFQMTNLVAIFTTIGESSITYL